MGKSKQSSGAELPVTIVVEARTDQAVKNLDNLTAANQRAEQAAAKSAVTFRTDAEAKKAGSLESFVLKARAENAAAAQEKLAAATEKVGKAAHKTGSLTKVLGSQVHNLAVGQSSFTQALNMTLSVLGPWGIAIGVATTLLGHFIGDQYEAAKAADEHTKKLREQKKVLAERARDDRRQEIETGAKKGFLTAGRQAELAAVKRIEAERQQAITDARSTVAEIEKQIAANKALKVDSEQLFRRKAEQLEIIALREGEIDSAKRIRDDEEERRLATEDEHHNKRMQNSAQELEALEKQIRASEKLFLAQHDSSAKFFSLEQANVKDERFTRPGTKSVDPFATDTQDALDKIEAESKARIKAREDALDAAAERSKKRHQEEIKRQNELLEKQEASGKMMGDTVSGLAAAWLSAGDLSAKGFRKVLAAWGKAESIKLGAVALSEGVQALVSAAFFNFPQAALHGAAAAQAAATAVVIAGMTGAVGGFGSISKNPKGGFGGNMFGAEGTGGSGSGSSSSAQTSNSQHDQLPTAGANTQLAQTGGGKGSAVINYNFAAGSIQSLGAIDEQTGLKLAQGIKKAEARLGGLQK